MLDECDNVKSKAMKTKIWIGDACVEFSRCQTVNLFTCVHSGLCVSLGHVSQTALIRFHFENKGCIPSSHSLYRPTHHPAVCSTLQSLLGLWPQVQPGVSHPPSTSFSLPLAHAMSKAQKTHFSMWRYPTDAHENIHTIADLMTLREIIHIFQDIK